MEIETVMSYIANSINPDGVRAQEIIESLAGGHPGGARARAAVRAAHQGALRRRAGLARLHGRADLPAAARAPDRHRARHQGRDRGRDRRDRALQRDHRGDRRGRLRDAGHGDRRSSTTRRATAACSRATCASTRPRASHRLSAVGESLRRSCDSLDYGETLTAVARLAVPEYADWCFVELLMPDGRIDRVVMEHVDPSKREFIEEYDRRYPLDPDSPVGSPKVIRTGEPELLSDIPDEFWEAVAQDPEQHRLLRRGRHRLGADRPDARARHGDRRHRARPQRLRPPLHRGRPRRGRRTWPTAARWRSTTRACTRAARALARRPARRSSRASPTRSPPRRPTARSSTPTTRPCGCSASPTRRGAAGGAAARDHARASSCSTTTAASRPARRSCPAAARWPASARRR